MGLVAGTFGAPFLHFFFTKVAPKLRFKGLSDAQFVFLRTTAHMGVVLPLNLFQFFMILGVLNLGLNWGKIWEVQLPKYKKAVLAGWKFWPPILLIMYKFIPIPF
jgi:hypothetical protein